LVWANSSFFAFGNISVNRNCSLFVDISKLVIQVPLCYVRTGTNCIFTNSFGSLQILLRISFCLLLLRRRDQERSWFEPSPGK
jgi:hypothetical protein